MRRRGFTLVETLVVLAIGIILWAILAPVFDRPVSFRETMMPAMQWQNVELGAAMDDIYRTLQVEKGISKNYAKHFQWETESLKKRRVSLETERRMPLKIVFGRLENAAHVKFEYLQRPVCRGDVGVFMIRDAKTTGEKRP